MAATKVSLASELSVIEPLLSPLSITLLPDQPHIGGERELMSAHKLVLMGLQSGRLVVVKVSQDALGAREIGHDKEVRDLLASLSFAADELLQPKELFFGERGGRTILVTEFIEQDRVFVVRPIEEQFFIALRAFEAQGGFHMTTYGHGREIKAVLAVYSADTYLDKTREFIRSIEEAAPELSSILSEANALISANRTTLERYEGHLIHNDFVPHNMRVRGRDLYVLDQTSFWFGNKYEGWARFINYMELHNPELAKLLVEYVEKNRPEEVFDLRLMRVYKLLHVLSYHASVLRKTEGDLHTLTKARLAFWGQMLACVLHEEPIPASLVEAYKHERDTLRSEEEKARQREFAVA